jgi:hypothetical protein
LFPTLNIFAFASALTLEIGDLKLRDIAEHGADCGFPCITYTSDTICIFDRFEDEIWDMAVEEAESLGCKNVAGMIAGFRRHDMLDNIGTFKNLMVWFACGKLAREIAP